VDLRKKDDNAMHILADNVEKITTFAGLLQAVSKDGVINHDIVSKILNIPDQELALYLINHDYQFKVGETGAILMDVDLVHGTMKEYFVEYRAFHHLGTHGFINYLSPEMNELMGYPKKPIYAVTKQDLFKRR